MYGAEQSQQSGAARINRLNRHAAEIVTEINVLIFWKYYYLRQGRYAVVVVCLFVCLLATLRKNLLTDLYEIFREGWQWAVNKMIKFRWRSGSRIRIQIATLVTRALARYALSQCF